MELLQEKRHYLGRQTLVFVFLGNQFLLELEVFGPETVEMRPDPEGIRYQQGFHWILGLSQKGAIVLTKGRAAILQTQESAG